MKPIAPGDFVTLTTLPPWVDRLAAPSPDVLRYGLGRTYRVDAIDEHGHLVLDVSGDIDARFGGTMNDIRIEPAFVTRA